MAYCAQPCDSYFIESHENQEQALRGSLRERERLRKQQTQAAIAEELSLLTSDEYRDDVLQHMENMELQTLPDVASIEVQTEIQWFMRPYLLDFLVEAHTAFELLPETLFLAINLLDRYCSRRVVYKRHYQLVGCAALLIAAKYGDRKENVPTIHELKKMCCSLYDDGMFTQMEWHVLQTVQWVIGHPTIDHFHQLAFEGQPYDSEVQFMATYISEIAMFHKEFVAKRPSDMARSSLALARCVLGRAVPLQADWSSKYDSETLLTLSHHLHRPSTVLFRKYASPRFARVSMILEDFLEKQAAIARYPAPPPTPPSDVPMNSIAKPNIPATPTKGQQPPSMVNGCMTPPITPTNPDGSFNCNQNMGAYRPITPSSSGNHTIMPRHNACHIPATTYVLPPIL